MYYVLLPSYVTLWNIHAGLAGGGPAFSFTFTDNHLNSHRFLLYNYRNFEDE